MIISEIKFEDYTSGRVFDYLFTLPGQLSEFEFKCKIAEARDRAAHVGLGKREFDKLWEAYKESRERDTNLSLQTEKQNDYTYEGVQYNTGYWRIDEDGVWKLDKFGRRIIACPHPVLPTGKIESLDDHQIKINIVYKVDGNWKSIEVEQQEIATSRKAISTLASKGILINDYNAALMVLFFSDMLRLNIGILPVIRASSHMGWIGKEFVPYSDLYILSEDPSKEVITNAVTAEGDYYTWVNHIRELRRGSGFFDLVDPNSGTRKRSFKVDNTLIRIILAASFAAPLVSKLNTYSCIVNIWGDTENGKSLAQRVAASVWGNPRGHNYIQSFAGTQYGHEVKAAYFHNLPYILEERQLVGADVNLDYLIYSLAEGVGKTRGGKEKGLREELRWETITITSGEMPVTSENSEAGAMQRTMEICSQGLAPIQDPAKTIDVIFNNYGQAGPEFIRLVSKPHIMEEARHRYKEVHQQLISMTTSKQAFIGALLVTADAIATKYIFEDGQALTANDVARHLLSTEQIDKNRRNKVLLDSWIATYYKNFSPEFTLDGRIERLVDIYGQTDKKGNTLIIASRFNNFCKDNGISSDSFKKWLETNGHFIRHGKDISFTHRFGASAPRVYDYHPYPDGNDTTNQADSDSNSLSQISNSDTP